MMETQPVSEMFLKPKWDDEQYQYKCEFNTTVTNLQTWLSVGCESIVCYKLSKTGLMRFSCKVLMQVLHESDIPKNQYCQHIHASWLSSKPTLLYQYFMQRNGNYHTQQQHTRVHHKILEFLNIVQFLWHILDDSWKFMKYLTFQIVIIHFVNKKVTMF